jgi:hypothetical protein
MLFSNYMYTCTVIERYTVSWLPKCTCTVLYFHMLILFISSTVQELVSLLKNAKNVPAPVHVVVCGRG